MPATQVRWVWLSKRVSVAASYTNRWPRLRTMTLERVSSCGLTTLWQVEHQILKSGRHSGQTRRGIRV